MAHHRDRRARSGADPRRARRGEAADGPDDDRLPHHYRFRRADQAGTEATHSGSPLGAAEVAGARAKLNWPYPPFEIPADCLAVWREAGKRGAADREAWQARLAVGPRRAELEAALSGDLPAEFAPKMAEYMAGLVAKAPSVATRNSSEMALEVINANIPTALGGSADLTHSNLTLTKGIASLTPEDFSGRYIRYGIREFGMSAAMNGISVHGGFIPFGGTFACFSDYARGAIRLSALMGIRVIYVLTHDSIGLGEDGPTHQPIEHYAMLRATPNLLVFRPADAVETAECWELSLGARRKRRRCCCCRARTCRRCASLRTRTFRRRAAMCCRKPKASAI